MRGPWTLNTTVPPSEPRMSIQLLRQRGMERGGPCTNSRSQCDSPVIACYGAVFPRARTHMRMWPLVLSTVRSPGLPHPGTGQGSVNINTAVGGMSGQRVSLIQGGCGTAVIPRNLISSLHTGVPSPPPPIPACAPAGVCYVAGGRTQRPAWRKQGKPLERGLTTEGACASR